MTIETMNSKSGQPVIAIDTAEEIGTVKHFVVAPDASRIERLHIDGRRSKAVFAEWSALESFGADRVMLANADEVSSSDEDRDLEAAKGKLDLIGALVLDTAGFERGTVADASFDTETGDITAITTSENVDVRQDQIHSLGSYALVVDA